MKISFNVQHLYYLPQYLPVYKELLRQGHLCEFVLYENTVSNELLEIIFSDKTTKILQLDNHQSALSHYQEHTPDWIIFGNYYPHYDQLPTKCKTAMLYHGIGVKDCYYDVELLQCDVRFTEGPHRTKEILRRHPKARLAEVGFAKLDPLLQEGNFNSQSLFERYKLNPNKKTILYAPTFYPSSLELMAKDWPQQFNEFNIIIKPHEFSLTKKKYKKQRERLLQWKQHNNVYLAEKTDFSLVPFMAIADLLISEASSALFEFSALDKPVIWCDFLKLRWNYRGIFRYRYEKRMDQTLKQYIDIAKHVKHFRDLKKAVSEELTQPDNFSSQRSRYSNDLIGHCDGEVSKRICQYLIENKN